MSTGAGASRSSTVFQHALLAARFPVRRAHGYRQLSTRPTRAQRGSDGCATRRVNARALASVELPASEKRESPADAFFLDEKKTSGNVPSGSREKLEKRRVLRLQLVEAPLRERVGLNFFTASCPRRPPVSSSQNLWK